MFKDPGPDCSGESDAETPFKTENSGQYYITDAHEEGGPQREAAFFEPYGNDNKVPDTKEQSLNEVGAPGGKSPPAQLEDQSAEKSFLRRHIDHISKDTDEKCGKGDAGDCLIGKSEVGNIKGKPW